MKNRIITRFLVTKSKKTIHRLGSLFDVKLLTILLIFVSFLQVNAQTTTLFSTDFSSASWAGITNICNTANQSTFDVYNGISFYSRTATPKPFVVNNAAGTMTWCNNNSSSGNYFIAIPITGVNGSITITVANGTTATRFNYSPPVAGSTPTTTTGSFAASVSGAPTTVTISSLTGSSYVVYLGRQGSGSTTLTSITITTPSVATSITGAATATAFTTTYGTASAAQSFPVSGSGLTANILATAPTGYEVSNDGITYANTATFTQTAGSASGTLRVRLAATAVPGGTYNTQNIVLSSTGATSVNIGTAAIGNSVSAKALTVTNLTAANKPYDGSTTVSVTGTATLSGVNGADAVTLGGTPAYSFATASAGTAKSVTTTGYTISGAQASYYTLTQPSLIADITKISLTIIAVDQIVGYGTPDTSVTAVGTYTATGFVNSETASVLSGSPSYTTNYTNTTAIGASGITITPALGTLSATNYSFDTFLPGNITVTSSLTPQTISFSLSSPVAYGSSNITLNGTATSGLTVSYVSSNPAVASVSGNILTINGVGTTTITASQTGDATYSAATPVSQVLDINCSSTSINTTTITTCDPYTWSNTGLTYSVSGIYDGTTTNCVTERLNLTINTQNTYYVDADGDGVGTGGGVLLCAATAPAGYAITNTDCDDANASVWRTATLYQDVDLDGYTDKSVTGICYGATPPTGYYTAASSPTKIWNFSDTAKWPLSSGIGVDDIVNDQLGVYPLLLSATANMGAVNASAITFPVTTTTAAFTTTNRFQLNGGGTAVANMPAQRYVYFDVDGPCRVLVWFRTGGSTLRTVYVTDGTNLINSLGSTVSTDNLVLKANYTGGAGRLYIYGDQACNLYKIEVTGANITTPSIVTAPSLAFVADTTLNTVDNNLDITFTDNAPWRAAVNMVKVGTTTLSAATDYELTAGQLRLKPSGGNAALTSPGTKKVNVFATGYSSSNTGVSQTINVGNVSASVSTASISAALALNTSSTITCTAKDQFGNPVAGYAFQFDVTITNNTAATTEAYVLDGVSYTSSASAISLIATTNASGVATFTAALPAYVNYADGISIQVKLADGTSTVGTAFSYTSTVDAAITQSPSTSNQSICQNGTATQLAVVASGALSYQWYANTSSSNIGGTLLAGANSSTYTPLTSIPGTTYYYCVVNGVANMLTSDVSGAITVNALVTYYADADGDGYGDAAVSLSACTQPIGYVIDNTDCDDSNASMHTSYSFYADTDGDGYGAGSLVDVCAVDASTPPTGYSITNTDCAPSDATMYASFSFYADTDGDGYGAGSLVDVCAVDASTPPSGYSSNNTDCAPENSAMHATYAFYTDADGDGYGVGSLESVCAVDALTAPVGYSLDNTDCNDANAAMHTSYPFYADGDGDGYGAGSLVSVCAVDALTAPAGYSIDNTDCNDANAAIHTSFSFYVDTDGDLYGTGSLVSVCAVDADTPPSGYSTNNLDCNDANAAVNPGHIEVLYNGIDDNCNGLLDEGNQLTTTLQSVSCGQTLTEMGSLIFAEINLSATAYRFKVVNNTTGDIQFVENTHQWFALNWMSTFDYATAYTVSVQLQIAGVWLGYYGSSCLVNSPDITSSTGTLQLVPSQCGVTLSSIGSVIYTTAQSGASGYRFRITDVTPNASGSNLVQVKERSYHWFALTMLNRYNYGSTYMVEVAVKTTGGYTSYGSPCYVYTPASPVLNSCGAVIPTSRSLVYTAITKSVSQYRFQVTKVSDQSSRTFDTSKFWFSFKVNVPGYTPSVTYSVRVAVMTAGTWSPFGDACEITSPAIPRMDINAELEFSANVFPNPYTEQFNLLVNTDSDERISYRVYDMLGKLIEADEFDYTALETKEFGRNYPTGVYNIIVTQGEERKTLRIIKR